MVGIEQHKTHLSKKYKERKKKSCVRNERLSKGLAFFQTHTLARTISANVMRAIERVRERVCACGVCAYLSRCLCEKFLSHKSKPRVSDTRKVWAFVTTRLQVLKSS